MTETEIRNDLNACGIKTAYDKTWMVCDVHKVLSSPKYTGVNIFNRQSYKLGDEPTFAEKILALLDQIHAMDKARAAKIIKIKNAIAEGNYYVSAAEVARRIIDQMDEP